MIRAALPALLAIATAAVSLAALVKLSSCATAGFTDLSDSGVVRQCRTVPLVFCDAAAPGERGCTVTLAETDPRLQRLDAGAYADKCVVNFLSGAHDIAGECVLGAVCKCTDDPYDAAAGPSWVCGP